MNISNLQILFAQMTTILGFIVSLFVLYRLLVKSKDATIELLKERVSSLTFELERNDSDVLLLRLEKRAKALEEELKIAVSEQQRDTNKINAIGNELHRYSHSFHEIYKELKKTKEYQEKCKERDDMCSNCFVLMDHKRDGEKTYFECPYCYSTKKGPPAQPCGWYD